MTYQGAQFPDASTKWPTPPASVDWTPLERHFARRVLQWSGKAATPRFPVGAKAIAFGFSLFALPWLYAAFILLQADAASLGGWVLALLGVLNAALPTALLRMSKTITLDGTTGTYYTAQNGIDPVGRQHVAGRLGDIVALQVLDKSIVVGRDSASDDFADAPSRFRAFEVNLVLRDGMRLHLLDDVDFWVIRQAAEQLSAMLAVPVWRKPGMRNWE